MVARTNANKTKNRNAHATSTNFVAAHYNDDTNIKKQTETEKTLKSFMVSMPVVDAILETTAVVTSGTGSVQVTNTMKVMIMQIKTKSEEDEEK